MLIADPDRTWERFAAKVNWPGSLEACWEWTAAKAQGYGRFNLGTHLPPNQQVVQAHRLAYTFLIGPIPEGLYIDHLCRNPPCVNPLHMEPVTHLENWARGESPTARNRRKSHCPQGHAYDEANTLVKVRLGRRGRDCRTCDLDRQRQLRVRAGAGIWNKAKTHCPQGHEYSPENTLILQKAKGPARQCRECNRVQCQARAQRRKEMAS